MEKKLKEFITDAIFYGSGTIILLICSFLFWSRNDDINNIYFCLIGMTLCFVMSGYTLCELLKYKKRIEKHANN